MISRRHLLKTMTTGVAAAGVTPLLGAPAVLAAAPIKVGFLMDTSGPFQVFGQPKLHAIQLAVDEINVAGGLLGRQVQLVHYDTQSDNKLYAQFAQQLVLKDRVVAVHGAITSAAREVIRPILSRGKIPYYYDMIYEGGVCDRNTIVTGPTPPQLLSKMIPYMIEKAGPRIYTVAADYNFGQYSAKWAEEIAAANKGQIVGTDFAPLDVNNFSAILNKIQQAKADVIYAVLVGPAHEAFYSQWAAAGLNKTIRLAAHAYGDSGENLRLPKTVTEGIITCKNVFDEVDTPANKAFQARWKAKFPSDKFIGTLAPADYQSMMLWAAAVKAANSTDRDAMLKASASGLSIEGPSGKVQFDPKTNHCLLNMSLAEVKDGAFAIQQTWEQLPPVIDDDRCDLVKNPGLNQQFGPTG
ncbi:ABC transporter substrate-binding protein [Rhodopseudomonas sp. HC1]|uniref:ABC transporter substrate-binding protein n=1 Tax=Rhodopseudomonas infernalis TaxID=2897386 RepID=UPI001EE833FA|nr:ABC transporter substrate-binding protein [Rhodopseudomonas infernalis]MCG6206087.1 ABC transporter substrate-binding protein [Rhodopseudomonas infernalis]